MTTIYILKTLLLTSDLTKMPKLKMQQHKIKNNITPVILRLSILFILGVFTLKYLTDFSYLKSIICVLPPVLIPLVHVIWKNKQKNQT